MLHYFRLHSRWRGRLCLSEMIEADILFFDILVLPIDRMVGCGMANTNATHIHSHFVDCGRTRYRCLALLHRYKNRRWPERKEGSQPVNGQTNASPAVHRFSSHFDAVKTVKVI
jgi:hypothetical protein